MENFKVRFNNIKGVSEKDIIEKRIECLRDEIEHLEELVQKITDNNAKNTSQDAPRAKKKVQDDTTTE